jgi:hypothetical protein
VKILNVKVVCYLLPIANNVEYYEGKNVKDKEQFLELEDPIKYLKK